jgi:Flp pilus assembly protein TadB
MAIDGRTISKQTEEKGAYESLGVRIVSAALIWVPVALVVWFAYVSGTWMGGWTMGVVSVLSAVLTVGVVWLFMKARRKRH